MSSANIKVTKMERRVSNIEINRKRNYTTQHEDVPSEVCVYGLMPSLSQKGIDVGLSQ